MNKSNFPFLPFVPRTLRALHLIGLALIFVLLGFKCFTQFSTKFDFVNYHFPFVLRFLGHNNIEYIYPLHETFWKGNPKLVVMVQSLLVRLTHSFSSASGIGLFGLVLAAGGLKFLFGPRFRMRWFLTACLATPLVLLNFGSGYDDLWTASCVALAMGALLNTALEGTTLKSAFIFFIAELAACLSKIVAWPAACLLAAAFLVLLWQLRSSFRIRTKLFFSALILFAVTFWPVRNWVYFHNPTYPHALPIFHRVVPKPSYDIAKDVQGNVGLSDRLKPNPNSLNFLISAFELTRFMQQSRPLQWTHEQWNPGIHQRQGGWNGFTMLWLAAFIFYATKKKWLPRIVVVTYLAILVVVSALPASWNLRYWLYIPLCGFVLISTLPLSAGGPSRRTLLCFSGALLCLALFVLSKTNALGGSYMPAGPAAVANFEARRFWLTHRPNGWKSPYLIPFNPRAIFWTGPTFSEYYVVVQ